MMMRLMLIVMVVDAGAAIEHGSAVALVSALVFMIGEALHGF